MGPITGMVLSAAPRTANTTASAAIKDFHRKPKELIKIRYPKVTVEHLERAPELKLRRAIVAEDLTQAGAGQNAEPLEAACLLIHIRGQSDRRITMGFTKLSDVFRE